MDLKTEKEFIKLELDKVEDVHIVEAIKNILALGKAKKFEQNLHPMTLEAFYERNEISRKAIDEKKLISQKEARSYFKRKHVR